MKALKAKIDQGVEVLVGQQVDITTIATVTAIRATVRDILFSTEADTAISTVTRFDTDLNFINKFHTFTTPAPRIRLVVQL